MIEFLNGGSNLDEDLANELLINTRLENIQSLRFDDEKWEIDETRFLIFGKYIFYINNFYIDLLNKYM